MIKKLIFDWGDVLHFVKIEEIIKELSEKYSVEYEKFRESERQERKRMDAGEISLEEYFSNMETSLGIKIDQEDFKKVFLKHISSNDELKEFIKKQKGKYKLVVLSNNSPLMWEICVKNEGLEKIFDEIFLSYKHKMKKPDPEFYKKAIGEDKPEECIFVDDKEICTEAAAKLGVKAVVYRTFPEFLEEMAKLGVKPDTAH